MATSDRKLGRIFLGFAGLCILAVPVIVITAFSQTSQEPQTEPLATENRNFDADAGAIIKSHDQMAREYLEGTSSERTLEAFYSRRQYAGSPPFIPHKVEEADGTSLECLTCHEKGGWTQELKRNTPITPHPENMSCRQCHARFVTEELFKVNQWMSLRPPLLGRSHLPGSPPPIAHDLQMRENCVACHVGPGAVAGIRVDHPSRGNCRQCHVPDAFAGLFERNSDD